jgi:putative ABC transport system permease protein
MNYLPQIIGTSTVQAFLELRANRLRTVLSLLGITIGIFCIIAVLTVLDSMKNGIQKDMATLGSDVLYIGRWPWTADDNGGEYKWWEYWRRPSMTPTEAHAVISQIPDVSSATLCFSTGGLNLKYQDLDASNVQGYAVTADFDKIQNFELTEGRYLSTAELDGTCNKIVIGSDLRTTLFPSEKTAVGKTVEFLGRQFVVVGVLKKMGQNMIGFDFDNSIIISYFQAAAMINIHSFNNDISLIVKGAHGSNLNELKYEVEGVLRRTRKVKPGQHNNFAINQLSQISKQIEMMFATIDVVGLLIGGISLLVGSFGIANIMFVTVKERTKIIGLKKAIGARKISILFEFLVEAVVLCLIGGLVGIIIVLLLGVVSTYAFHFEAVLSFKNFFTGIVVSIVVGVLSGFIPAWSASRLDPVVAIRSN